MTDQKRYFVAWSGGLDSTAMMLRLLKAGHHVVSCYVEVENNEAKTKRERFAIDRMRPWFLNTFPEQYTDFGEIGKIKLARGAGENMSMAYSFLLTPFLCGSHNDGEIIALGYVMGDDAISYLPEIEALYKAFNPFSSHQIQVEFPLKQAHKKELAHELAREGLLNAVTWCESWKEDDNCGRCVPCKISALHNIRPVPEMDEDLCCETIDNDTQTQST